MHAKEVQPLLEKLKQLPPERIAEVEDFIDFLRARSQGPCVSRKTPSDFPVISVGRWPDGLSLRREEMYGDDGR